MFKNIQEVITRFFHSLEIDYETLEITQEENTIKIKIITDESGLLIGSHGKNFDCIEHILRQIINNNTGDIRYRLHIDINDYQSSKDERLFQFVQSKIDEVKKTGIEYILPYYSPYERKKIHSYVAKLSDKSFYVKSKGEGSKRKIHIIKQEQKLTIDIDGDNI